MYALPIGGHAAGPLAQPQCASRTSCHARIICILCLFAVVFAIKPTLVLPSHFQGQKVTFFSQNAWFKIPGLNKFTNCYLQPYTCIVKSPNKSINLIFVAWNNTNFHASWSYMLFTFGKKTLVTFIMIMQCLLMSLIFPIG